MGNPTTLSTGASEQDQWEFDRQQNIIDQIAADKTNGVYADDPTAEVTVDKRSREAQAIQNYLLKKNLASETANEAVAANPRPKESES